MCVRACADMQVITPERVPIPFLPPPPPNCGRRGRAQSPSPSRPRSRADTAPLAQNGASARSRSAWGRGKESEKPPGLGTTPRWRNLRGPAQSEELLVGVIRKTHSLAKSQSPNIPCKMHQRLTSGTSGLATSLNFLCLPLKWHQAQKG